MAIRPSSPQEYQPAPKLEAYESQQAWFHDLTDWFINIGLKVQRLEPPAAPESKQTRNILRWHSTAPYKFKIFRDQQARLIKGGHCPVFTGMALKPCPACGCTERISLAMMQGRKDVADFDICLRCWKVVESFPVYDDGGCS